MASLWTGLLFLHGHISDSELARRLDGVEQPACKPHRGGKPRQISQPWWSVLATRRRLATGK